MRSYPPNGILPLILLFFSLVNNAYGTGIVFTAPAGGGTWPGGGQITVQWSDGGGSPNMAQLTTYKLELVVGGNLPSNSKVIATLGNGDGQVSEGSIEDHIAKDVAQSIENGFYLKMTSNTTSGSQVINYSNRFTLINLNGTTDSPYLDGANGISGMSDVPSGTVISNPSATSSPSTSSSLSSGIATTTTTASETPGPPPSGNDELSTGVIAGIGIGGALALIGLLSLFGWAYVFYRHKKRKQRQPEHALETAPRVSKYGGAAFLGNKVELPTDTAESSRSRLELNPTDERYEVDGSMKAVEAARASIYELEGDWSGWEAGAGRQTKAYDPTAM